MSTDWEIAHADTVAGALLSQHRHPDTMRLVRAFAAPVQALEDLAQHTYRARTLAHASGASLDFWGAVVGERRDGLDDATFRRFIQARILTNSSEGEIWRVVEIARLLTGSDRILYRPLYPAACLIQFEVSEWLPDALASRIRAQLLRALGAGVGLSLIEALPGSLILSESATTSERLGVGLLARRIT